MSELARRFGARMGSAGMQLCITLLMTRNMGLASYGGFTYLIGIYAATNAISSLGVPTRLLRSADETYSALRGGMTITYGATIVTAAIMFVCAEITGLVISSGTIAVAISFAASENIARAVTAWLSATSPASADYVIIGQRLLPAAAGMVGVLYGSIETCMALGYVGSILAMHVVVHVRQRDLLHLSTVQVFAQSRNYWSANVASATQQADSVVIGHGLGERAVAPFGAAFRLASPVHIVTTSLISIYIPKIISGGSPGRETKRLLRWAHLYFGVLILATPLAALALPRLAGAAYTGHAVIFVILYLNSALSVINQVTTSIAFIDHENRRISRASWISSVGGLVIVCIGTAQASLWMATVGTASIQVILYFLLFPEYIRIRQRANESTSCVL